VLVSFTHKVARSVVAEGISCRGSNFWFFFSLDLARPALEDIRSAVRILVRDLDGPVMATAFLVGGATARHAEPEPQWAEGLDEEDLDALRQAHYDETKIVLQSPVRLGYFPLFCLITNRMIGKLD
jgi:hypothetical protein